MAHRMRTEAERRQLVAAWFTTVEVIPDPPAPPLMVQVAGCGHRIKVPAGLDAGGR